MARDRFQGSDIAKVRLRLLNDRNMNTRQYNSPSYSKVAAVIIGDFNMHSSSRDIIIKHQTNGLYCISELHPSFMAMQYLLLFSYGEDGFHTEIVRRSVAGKQQQKHQNMSIREFYAYRLHYRIFEGHTL